MEVYFTQMSVICFRRGINCCPFYRGVPKARVYCITLFCLSRSFRPLYVNLLEDFRRLPKIPEDCRKFLKANEEVRPLPKMSEEPPQTLNSRFFETANIKKLANLTAKTKNYGQITLNTKPHSDPFVNLSRSLVKCKALATFHFISLFHYPPPSFSRRP